MATGDEPAMQQVISGPRAATADVSEWIFTSSANLEV